MMLGLLAIGAAVKSIFKRDPEIVQARLDYRLAKKEAKLDYKSDKQEEKTERVKYRTGRVKSRQEGKTARVEARQEGHTARVTERQTEHTARVSERQSTKKKRIGAKERSGFYTPEGVAARTAWLGDAATAAGMVGAAALADGDFSYGGTTTVGSSTGETDWTVPILIAGGVAAIAIVATSGKKGKGKGKGKK